jgi:hypothetical protein
LRPRVNHRDRRLRAFQGMDCDLQQPTSASARWMLPGGVHSGLPVRPAAGVR